MDKRPFTCCFTGHRNLPAGQEEEIWRRVYACLEPLLEEGMRYFGVGGALGFDTLVAEKLLALRESRPQIRIILVQPFPGYQSRWTPAQQARAAVVEARVDKVVVCCQTPGHEAFLASGGWLLLLYRLVYPLHRRHRLHPALCAKAGPAGVERGPDRRIGVIAPCRKSSVYL